MGLERSRYVWGLARFSICKANVGGGREGEQLNSPGTPLTRLSSVTCLAVVAQVCQPHPQPGEFTELGAHPFKPGVMPSPAWNASPLLCGNYVNLVQGVSMATANWEMRHS